MPQLNLLIASTSQKMISSTSVGEAENLLAILSIKTQNLKPKSMGFNQIRQAL